MGSKQDLTIRVGDAEREAAMSMLGEHMSQGRLDLAEFETRTGQVAAARTRGELEEIFTDLPAPHPDLSNVAKPSKPGKPKAPKGSRQVATRRPSSPGRNAVNFLRSIALPAAIVFTILYGMWWLFIPAAFLIFSAGHRR